MYTEVKPVRTVSDWHRDTLENSHSLFFLDKASSTNLPDNEIKAEASCFIGRPGWMDIGRKGVHPSIQHSSAPLCTQVYRTVEYTYSAVPACSTECRLQAHCALHSRLWKEKTRCGGPRSMDRVSRWQTATGGERCGCGWGKGACWVGWERWGDHSSAKEREDDTELHTREHLGKKGTLPCDWCDMMPCSQTTHP